MDKGEAYVHRFFLEVQAEPMTPFLQSIFTNILTYLETLKDKAPLSEKIIEEIEAYAEESGFTHKITEKRKVPSHQLSFEELSRSSSTEPLVWLSQSTKADLLGLHTPKTREALGLSLALKAGIKAHYTEPFLDRIKPLNREDSTPNPRTYPQLDRLHRFPQLSTAFASKHLALFRAEPHEGTP
jgi:hypothetical protein